MSNKVLSQDEIDELLHAIESCEKDTKPEERTRKVKIIVRWGRWRALS